MKIDHMDTILKWFISDTIELLDQKLDDSESDPQYSAITVKNRFALYLEQIRACTVDDAEVFQFISECGYSDADVQQFRLQCADELRRYPDR